MFFTIYKTINILSRKYYIGKHKTKNINDSYLGSGKAILNAIKRYGKENFRKEILFVFDNEVDMDNKEKELVTEEFINNVKNYNCGIGGKGGPHFKNKVHSEETKQKISETVKKTFSCEEVKKKFLKACKKRVYLNTLKNGRNANYKVSRKKWVRNLEKTQEKLIKREENISNGWEKGRIIDCGFKVSPNKGKKLSKEHKKKISEAKKRYEQNKHIKNNAG